MDSSQLEGMFALWGQHGLAGLVILALFLGLAHLSYACRKDSREARTDTAKERDTLRVEYTKSLQDITHSQEKSADKVIHVLEKIEELIHQQAARH